MDQFFRIFIESAWTASLIPLSSEATLYAMKSFGQDVTLAVIPAILGGTLGMMTNFLLGMLMLRAKRSGIPVIGERTYDKAQRFFNKYLFFLLFLSFLPMFKFLVLAAGFLGTRPRYALILVALGYVLHYGMVLL
jgi:membrane protein YqaA with SNARE-associated domain